MGETLPSTGWREAITPGEAERIRGYVRDAGTLQQREAVLMGGKSRRTFHVKIYCGASAEFRVPNDIPAFARHGVFEPGKTYAAWVRISNAYPYAVPDSLPTLFGLAVKLTGVAGTKLLAGDEEASTQDFLAISGPPIPDLGPRQFINLLLSPKNPVTAPLKLVRSLSLGDGLRFARFGLDVARSQPRSLALATYRSALPVALGPCAFKFIWQPGASASQGGRSSLAWNGLRDELRDRLAAGDVTFDFMAQFYVNDRATPVEGTHPWDPVDAPFVKLAELVIRQRDLGSAESRLEERYVDSLAFNPWHAIPDHRPIGEAQRARGAVYLASSLNWGHAEEPRYNELS